MTPHAHSAGCRDLADRLSEYLDQEVEPAVYAEIEKHLDDCPPCRDFLESLRRTVHLVREVPASGVIPDDVKKRIVEAYRRARESRGS